jgi:hypothetical protein
VLPSVAKSLSLQGSEHPDYRLHTLGWRSFQDLCSTIIREVFGQDARFFGDGADGGRDGAWRGTWTSPNADNKTYNGSFTFQCKFSSKADSRLTAAQIIPELPKIASLVRRGLSDNYFLITNSGVSAEQQAIIEETIRSRGAQGAVVLDRDWITTTIREHKRLRLLVPRIYGLGDIRDFLDGEALQQSQAILSYLSHDLEKLVVTTAHKKAAAALIEHHFVMLLGAPRVGKSIIAAILALAALDNWHSETFLVRSVDEIIEHWRPDGPRQFFWLDDVFGTNQVQSDRVDNWNR